jgi:hypothetical protein
MSGRWVDFSVDSALESDPINGMTALLLRMESRTSINKSGCSSESLEWNSLNIDLMSLIDLGEKSVDMLFLILSINSDAVLVTLVPRSRVFIRCFSESILTKLNEVVAVETPPMIPAINCSLAQC